MEIKEILDYLKIENGHCSSELSYEETHLLLDYITNLQQELEIMVKDDERSQETIIKLSKENERLKLEKNTKSASEIICENLHDVYKSRCEKAVEFMKDFIFEPLLVQEDRKLIMYNENLRKFENILNGRSDE